MPPSSHPRWGAEALHRQLEPLLPGLGVEIVARLGSTNTELLERVRGVGGRRSGDARPCLLVAEQQTQGRGRRGRVWQSSAGASLTFSIMLPLAPVTWSGLSLAVGLALADALDPTPTPARAPRIGLKWPNDLWLWEGPARGRKLGGILIETVSVGSKHMAVVGVGLNIHAQATDGLSQGYAALDELDPGVSAPLALATVAAPLAGALKRFEAEGLSPRLADYGLRDVLSGHAVTLHGADTGGGVAEGVDASGALCVRRPGGLQQVVSGEVSVRLPGAEGGTGPDDSPRC